MERNIRKIVSYSENQNRMKDEMARSVATLLEEKLERNPTFPEIAEGVSTIYEEIRKDERW